MLKKEAHKIVGGLSKPGKMPGPAYNLPAWNCITGSKLRKVKTSPCYGCYALKLRYTWPIVRQAMDRRLQAIESPKWVGAMVVLVTGHPFLDGTTQAIYKALNIFKKFLKCVDKRQRRSTGCPHRNVSS